MNALWLRNAYWVKLILAGLIIGVLAAAYHLTVGGESTTPKFVLMRLEDIGPGGEYRSPERLGKLRAVFEYLNSRHIPYHLAVVPRWIDFPAEGGRYDVAIDETDNTFAQSFNLVLKQAIEGGAVAGMHGYTHQIGTVRRGDGHHEPGIGNEFNMPGVEKSMTAKYANERLSEGLRIMERAGIRPIFWEAPHYRSTPEQDVVFRSYFGLHYQAEVQEHRFAPQAFYFNNRNSGYGSSTLGAAYVPTPYDYIAYNKDEHVILDRLGKTGNVVSFFYHPFLEFKHLLPVVDDEGNALERDGLPVYEYPAQDKSNLQKLIAGLKAKEYQFYSITDYVPFTPANSVVLSLSGQGERDDNGSIEQSLLLGDVTGDRQSDVVEWDKSSGDIRVTPCDFSRLRNASQLPSRTWARAAYRNGSAAALVDENSDGASDLLIVRPTGRMELYLSRRETFAFDRSWVIPAASWRQVMALKQRNGDVLLAGLSQDGRTVNGIVLSEKGTVMPLKPFRLRREAKTEPLAYKAGSDSPGLLIVKKNASTGIYLTLDEGLHEWKARRLELDAPNEVGIARLGDFNGDGLQDFIRWDEETERYKVYRQQQDGAYRLLSTFGPWGKPGQRLYIADLDGNGKDDLAVAGPQKRFLDTALSFESLSY